jgi:hypothetical protein
MLAAAELPPVEVPTCEFGNAFTLKIPVRVPADAFVQYEWYRNDTLIEGSHKLMLPNENKITYTVPANEAVGDSVVYYFKYGASESGHRDCSEWVASRKYILRFLTPTDCQLNTTGSIEGDEEAHDVTCHLSATGSIEAAEVVYNHNFCELSSTGSIEGS